MTSENDDTASELEALLDLLGIAEGPVMPQRDAGTSDAERALVAWLLYGRLAHPEGPPAGGKWLHDMLDDAEDRFGQQVILQYLREVGSRIAGEFPLPRTAGPERSAPAGHAHDRAACLCIADPREREMPGAEPPDAAPTSGLDRRHNPRRPSPDGRGIDAYVFAVLQGLYGAWFTRLDSMARIDGLTGIANRREFDHYLPLAWAAAARQGEPVTLLMIDVDLFKPYNDRYGHLAGDDCLRAIARAIECTVRRPGDLAARFGGEEFAVVLPATDAAGARLVAESIREAIRNAAIRHEGGIGNGHITVSLGIAVCTPPPDVHPDEFIRVADEALYVAKRTGRDRAVLVNMRSWWI